MLMWLGDTVNKTYFFSSQSNLFRCPNRVEWIWTKTFLLHLLSIKILKLQFIVITHVVTYLNYGSVYKREQRYGGL